MAKKKLSQSLRPRKMRLNQQTIDAAKRAFAAKTKSTERDPMKIAFHRTVDFAVEQHLDTIAAGLRSAGFVKQTSDTKRPRPVSDQTWGKLVAAIDKAELDADPTSVIRASLWLLAHHGE